MPIHHFACTLCGLCCKGRLPLTLDEAMAHAARFPLAMMWTLVHQKERAFDLVAQMGTTLTLANKKQVALLISPTLYIPRDDSCPALTETNRCGLQDNKPLRCKTMPLYPYREEAEQAALLVPRKDWQCDLSESAPVIYKDKIISDKTDFDRERAALLDQAPALRAYAEKMLRQNPVVAQNLAPLSQNAAGGHFILSFFSFLRLNASYDLSAFAKAQRPVLLAFAKKTPSDPYYKTAAEELTWFEKK